MNDYISREALRDALYEADAITMKGVAIINQFPAADVRLVVMARWIAEKEDVEWGNFTIRYRCSCCKRLPNFDKESYKFILSDFCPKCGADMREES